MEFYKCVSVNISAKTWDGYMAKWVSGVRTDPTDIIITCDEWGAEGPVIFKMVDKAATDGNRKWKATIQSVEHTLEYSSNLTYSWAIFKNGNPFVASYSGATQNADISEICSGLWSDDQWATESKCTLTQGGDVIDTEMAGWVFADELTTGLTVKGYTPEVDRIYLEDTTIDATLYPDEVGGGSSDSVVYDSIRVSDGNSIDYICFGLYTPKDPTATGGNRVWELVDGSSNNMTISYDAAIWNAWVIKSGSTYVFKIDAFVGASIEEICAGTISSTGNGSEPYPKLTPAVSTGSDSGSSGTVSLPGLSMDVPNGTQNCVIIVSYSGLTGSYPEMALAFSPRNMADTGTSRKWDAYWQQHKYTITYAAGAWRIMNPANMTDADGDGSADPWNCKWTHTTATGATINAMAFIAI